MKDTAKYSEAAKRRWSKVPANRRVEKMRAVALARWGKASAEYKRENAMRMVEARARKQASGD